MKKTKLKKSFKRLIYIIIVISLFLSIGIYSTIKIKKQKEYENTYEYKLITIGYNETDTKDIINTFKDKELEFLLNNEVNDNYLKLTKEKYFIYDKFYSYLDYLNNKNISLRDVIERVNTNTNNEYYSISYDTDISKNELMLVNKYYHLDENYTPLNLVTIPTTYAWGDYGSQKVTKDTYDAFLKLWNASHDNGFYLMVSSSYRTYQKQQEVYDAYRKSQGEDYADSIAARPGYSEHQTGYSLDIFEKGYVQKDFQNSDSYEWLKNNAHKYGFIERYPMDKEEITGYNFESWHYRYVGVDVATYIYNNNITFDEYYTYFVN